MSTDEFSTLLSINSPADLKQLSEDKLVPLAHELRNYLLQALNQCGGHFAGNLGTVELAIALHYVYNTPVDKLIWDVGHQAYAHKILTGRRDQITTIRQTDGLAPFPKREESEYDCFTVGHSSTSISAATGMALAAELNHENKSTVAIIGDGAMTAGMAFEALNHAGDVRANVLVILNDNDMSISKNVGSLSKYSGKILASKTYSTLREGGKKVLDHMPTMWELAKKAEAQMKHMVVPGTLYEEMGFNYIGPIDGHDVLKLVKVLSNLKKLKGPQFLHIRTKKGKGYAPAEADPIKYHAVKAGYLDQDKQTMTKPSTTAIKKQPTYSNIFGEWLVDMATIDKDLIAITPAMCEGSDMNAFVEKFPKRYFDVGIAEQHSVTLAAGLACEGKKPVVAIYSTFLQRAYDQLIHDVLIQNLNVLFAIDRAGLVGGDGATHNGVFDLSYLRILPNIVVMTPSDENECRQMLYTGFIHQGPAAIRYPRGIGSGATVQPAMHALPLGKAEVKRRGKKIAILAFGSMVTPAQAVGDTLNATVVNMRFVKPLDTYLIKELATTHELLVTLEENTIAGGAGSTINDYLASQAIPSNVLNLGLPDKFIHHGEPQTLLARCGLDTKGIINSIKEFQGCGHSLSLAKA